MSIVILLLTVVAFIAHSENGRFDNETKELHSGGETLKSPSGGVGKYLFKQMRKHAANNLIAQIEGETGIEESYHDFLQKCIKLALFMKDQGLKQGDIISMCSQNTMNNSAVFVASFLIGVVIASTDPLLSVESTAQLLNLVKPKMVFVCEKSLELIKTALEKSNTAKIIALYHDDSMANIRTILNQYSEDDVNLFQPISIKDTKNVALIMFSSGTTGMPKGICLSHDSLGAECYNSKCNIGTRVCGFTTLYWSSGAFVCLQAVSTGAIKVNYREYVGQSFWDELGKRKINFAFLSYNHCIDVLQYLKHSMPHLKILGIVGGKLPVKYYMEFTERLPNLSVFCHYGMTEIFGISGHSKEIKCPPGSAGVIYPNNLVVKIVDPETETALDLNNVGEIRVKGAHQLVGYYNQDSSDCWDKQGFFKTGDLGYFDDNYYLYVVDRIKEMFKYKSWHVIPAKIEATLIQHPAILHAIVIGIPVEDSENHAMAVVVLKDGYLVKSDELIEFVNSKMDNIHQIRAGVRFIKDNEIPYTVTGKINRRKLRQMLIN